MPGSSRHFASSLNDLKTEVEITDIRIWNGKKDTLLIDSKASSVKEKFVSHLDQ